MSDNQSKKSKRRIRIKSVLLFAALAAVVLLILFCVMRIYKSAYQAKYDKQSSPMTFSMEDIAEFVDSNEDAKLTPAEFILMDSLKQELERAKKEKKRMFISVGHITWDQWLTFKSLDDLVLYCKLDHSFRNIHVQKSFYDIKRPTYCWEGYGGYLEIDGERNLKALWIYRPYRFGAVCVQCFPRLILRAFCSDESYMNIAGYFFDKNFNWQRIPSTLLNEILITGKYSKMKAAHGVDSVTTPTVFLGNNLAENFDRFKELKSLKRTVWEINSDIQTELAKRSLSEKEKRVLEPITQDISQAKTLVDLHDVMMKNLDKIKKEFYELSEIHYDVSRIFTATCREILEKTSDEIKPSYLEDTLFYSACLKSGNTKLAVELIETLDRLERDFPESRFLPSAFLYRADAYVLLARDAYSGDPQYNISMEAAVKYYLKAFKQIDKAIEYISKNGDTALEGVPGIWGNSNTMLDVGMIGHSSLKAAILLRSRIASQIQQSKMEIKYGSALEKYLSGKMGPDLILED